MIVVLPTDPAVLNHAEYHGKCYATGLRTSLYASHNGCISQFWSNYLTLSSQCFPGTDAKYIAIPPNFGMTPELLLLVSYKQRQSPRS